MLRVVIWNLGFWLHRSKHMKTWDYLRNQIKPDLALLQEVGPTKMFRDERLLLNKVRSEWGTAIYSQNLLTEEFTIMEKYPGRLVSAQIKVASKEKIIAVSIHAPIIGGRVFPYLSKIFDTIESKVKNYSFIIGGDLNTARLAEKVWPGHGHGPFFEHLSKSIFFDCHHKFHEVEEQTYYRKDSKYPFQDDHLFVSQNLADKIKSCFVLNNEATRNLSDHLPVVAEISL